MRLSRWMILSCLALGLIWTVAIPARAIGQTWTVNRPGDDAANGDLTTYSGSLRFVLANAQSGDLVRIGDIGADSIFLATTLVVPPGVTVGRGRDEPCGDPTRPLTNLQGLPSLSGPIVSLGAGATFRNLTVSGPGTAMAITGADVDVCAVAFGQGFDPEGLPLEVTAPTVALAINGAAASVHRSRIGGAITVGTSGDGTIIGDSAGTSGEANIMLARANVSVVALGADAARQITIRDPFPRALLGIVGAGVAGGDDDPAHANAWSRTPTISGAASADGFATVQVSGTASPLALVDIFFQYAGEVTRQAPAYADAAGNFSFSGPLPGQPVSVFAVSTLADPAHPGRYGSSSQLSASVPVVAGSAPPPPPSPEPSPSPNLLPQVWLPLLVQ